MTSQFDLIVHDCKGVGEEKAREFVGRLRAELYGNAKFAHIRELLDAIPEDNQAKPQHDWIALNRALAENTTLSAIGDLIAHYLTAAGSGVPGVQAVLTTNVDNLLQCYVMSKLGGQRRLDTVSDCSSAQLPGNVPVYHLHGWLDLRMQRQRGVVREPPLVFKESEYFSTIASPHSFANNTAQHYFQRSRVLFIGTSLEDLNVRRWLFNAFQERMIAHRSRLECRFPAYSSAASEAYAASIRHFWFRRASDLPEPCATMQAFLEDAMRHLGVEVIWYDDHAQIAAWVRDLAAGD
jgi:hypothetical protein